MLSPIRGRDKPIKTCQFEEKTGQANTARADFDADQVEVLGAAGLRLVVVVLLGEVQLVHQVVALEQVEGAVDRRRPRRSRN